MTCANFQELEAGLGAANQLTISPIDFPFDNDTDLRLDIYNYEDEQWNNVPIATGATLNVGGAGDVFYSWEIFDDNGQRAVRTVLATAGTTPPLPAGGTASHPLVPANNNYPVEGGVGVNVRLYRMTSIDRGDMPATFYPGSAVKAEDLNANFEALRKVVEESACSTNNVTDAAPLLDQRYWNKLDDTLEDGDAWVSDDAHIATTAAGDTRWLNATGGNVVGGAGIGVTEAGGNVTIAVDLAATSGLETDPAGNTGELRIDVNDGCEIVAAGLNAETTDASIIQTGGTDANPAIRIRKTLGTATNDDDLQITGGANVTVTRNSDNQLTIAAAAATGGATFRGTVDVDNDNTLPATTGQQNPNAVNIGDGFTVENNVAAADVTANWNTVLDNWDTGDGIINSGDVILCTTAADAGSPTDARYNLIRTGGNINTLQQVTDAGNTTTNNIVLQTGADVNTNLNANGSAVFNENGDSVDFRVESNNNENTLFVRGANDRVGIRTNSPQSGLDVRADMQVSNAGGTTTFIGMGGNAVFNEQGGDFDFRVESDGNENMLFVDGGNDRVGIGINAPLGTLHIVGPNEAASGQLRIVSNADNQNARATFYRNGTFVGSIQADASNLWFQLEGTNDWRVQTDTTQNMLFVDGGEDRVGINTNAPDSTLAVNGQVTIDQNAITAGAGNFNLANGNFWTLGAVVVPNPTNMVAGMSGLIVNTAAATWPAAGGATFQYAANTPPNITEFPAVIPFYCTNNTTIFIGTPTVNIV